MYIFDIQTCICVQVYTRLRGMFGVEAPTFYDACFLGLHVVLSADLLKEKGLNILDVLIDELNVVITHSDSLPLLLLLVLVDGYEEKCESLFVPALLSLSLSFCEGIFTSSVAAAANVDGG